MESAKRKRKVSDNSGHKIMKHFKILVWFDSSQVVHEIYYKKHCIRVTSTNLRLSLRTKDLSKFGNGKNPKMVLVVKNCQKTILKFLVLSNFAWILDTVSLILSAIAASLSRGPKSTLCFKKYSVLSFSEKTKNSRQKMTEITMGHDKIVIVTHNVLRKRCPNFFNILQPLYLVHILPCIIIPRASVNFMQLLKEADITLIVNN